MRTRVQVALLASLLSMGVGTLLLTGCGTWKGLGKDIGKVGGAMEGKETVAVTGTEGRQMTVTVPRSVTVQRGQAETVEVKIERKNFTDSVRVAVSQLPRGVKADDSSQKVEAGTATFVLKATNSAGLVSKHAVKVTVDGPGSMQTVQFFPLTVKE